MNEMHYTADELTEIKGDLWRVLNALPNEVPYLRDAIVDGRIDGGIYIDPFNGCGCLVGTLLIGRGVTWGDVAREDAEDWNIDPDKLAAISPVTLNPFNPIEDYTLLIEKGDTPATSPYSAQLLAWVDEWLAEQAAQHEALKLDELERALSTVDFFREVERKGLTVHYR